MSTQTMRDQFCHSLILKYLESHDLDASATALREEIKSKNSWDSDQLLPTELKEIVLEQVVDHWLSISASRNTLPSQCIESDPLQNSVAPLGFNFPSKIFKTLGNVHNTNILSVQFHILRKRIFDTTLADYRVEEEPCIVTTAADKTIKFISTKSYEIEEFIEPSKSVVLSVSFHPTFPNLFVCGGMDGTIQIYNLHSHQVLANLKAHSKYVVKVLWNAKGNCFATASYDRNVNIYKFEFEDEEKVNLQLVHTESFTTNPESLLFLPEDSTLIISCRNSNYLTLLRLPLSTTNERNLEVKKELINLNENGDNHISYSIMAMSLHPSGQYISLQTDTNLARIFLLRLPLQSFSSLKTLYTNAEQSEFSNPRHVWFSSGAAVIVTSDEGLLRIVDLNGKILKVIPAHGVAAPIEDDSGKSFRKTGAELIKARKESMAGSSLIKDVCILPNDSIVSVGFDRTIRIANTI